MCSSDLQLKPHHFVNERGTAATDEKKQQNRKETAHGERPFSFAQVSLPQVPGARGFLSRHPVQSRPFETGFYFAKKHFAIERSVTWSFCP